MVSFTKRVEDRPTPPCVYNRRIYIAAVVAACAALMVGYDSAFFGTTIALPGFKNEFNLNSKTAVQLAGINANLVSCYQAGALVGSILGYPLGHFLGRKYGLFSAAVIFCLGAGIMCGANGARGLGLVYGGRAIAGAGIGAATNLTPLYISEISPPAIRGALVGVYEIAWQLGQVVGFWTPYGLNQHYAPVHNQWFIAFAVQLIPGALFMILIPFCIVESPRWLVTRGKSDKAVSLLSYLRDLDADHPYLVEEIGEIEAQHSKDVAEAGSGFLSPILLVVRNKAIFWRLFLTTTLFIWQNGTGINAINYYSPTILRSIGVTGTSTALLTTGVFGVIKSVFSIIWAFWLIDRYGRRPLLLIGSAGGAIGMYAIGAYIAIAKPAQNPTTTLPPGGKAAIFFLYFYTVFYSISWNGTPWVICSESFSGSVRNVVLLSTSSANWAWNLVIARSTPYMFLSMGYGTFIFFATMMVLSMVYVSFLIPESKHIPLEQMDRLWAHPSAWKANKLVMTELKAEHAGMSADKHAHVEHKETSSFAGKGSDNQVEVA